MSKRRQSCPRPPGYDLPETEKAAQKAERVADNIEHILEEVFNVIVKYRDGQVELSAVIKTIGAAGQPFAGFTFVVDEYAHWLRITDEGVKLHVSRVYVSGRKKNPCRDHLLDAIYWLKAAINDVQGDSKKAEILNCLNHSLEFMQKARS